MTQPDKGKLHFRCPNAQTLPEILEYAIILRTHELAIIV